MRIERLGINKIKITLETDDLMRWDVNFDNLSEDSTRSQEMFWDVMRKVEEEMDINFENCRITVEAVPAEDDTLVMIITKSELDQQVRDGFVNAALRKYKYRIRKQQKPSELPVLLFDFATFDDICRFANDCRDYTECFGKHSSLFRYGGRYYLAVLIPASLSSSVGDFSNKLSEYGRLVENSAIKLAFLSEHGEPMIKNNALKVLENYFYQKE